MGGGDFFVFGSSRRKDLLNLSREIITNDCTNKLLRRMDDIKRRREREREGEREREVKN